MGPGQSAVQAEADVCSPAWADRADGRDPP